MTRKIDEKKFKRILKVAYALFQQKGYQKTSIEDIARRAGIAKGTIYIYYRGKIEILLRMGVEHLAKANVKLLRHLKQTSDISKKIQLILLFRAEAIYDFVHEHPYAVELFWSVSAEAGDRQGAQAFFKAYEQLLADTILKGIESGLFRKVDSIEDLAHHICYMSRVFQPPYNLTESKKELSDMVIRYSEILSAGLRP